MAEAPYIPEVWTVNLKKEDKKMVDKKDLLPKVKLRLKGISRGPIEMTIAPKRKVILDENGVVEVDEGLARKLLSPDYAGAGWELYKESEEPAKGKRSTKPEDEKKEVSKEDFAQQI